MISVISTSFIPSFQATNLRRSNAENQIVKRSVYNCRLARSVFFGSCFNYFQLMDLSLVPYSSQRKTNSAVSTENSCQCASVVSGVNAHLQTERSLCKCDLWRPTVKEDRPCWPCCKNVSISEPTNMHQIISKPRAVSWWLWCRMCPHSLRERLGNFGPGPKGPVRGHMVQGFRQLGFTHLELLELKLEICRDTVGLPVWYTCPVDLPSFFSRLPYLLFVLAFFLLCAFF